MRIRTVKSKSGSTVVQVGYDEGKNFRIHKHIGSAKNDEELEILFEIARRVLEQGKSPLFRDTQKSEALIKSDFVQISKLETLGHLRSYAYNKLSKYFEKVFTFLPSSSHSSPHSKSKSKSHSDNFTLKDYLKNLSIMRITKPTSKLEAVEYLSEYFGITYSKSDLHRKLLGLLELEDKVFESAINYAKKHLGFKFQFVFYDVTTLYFETHLTHEEKEFSLEDKIEEDNGDKEKEDKEKEEITEIRQYGFSKDKRNDLPQILIGLIVDENGFPIYYQVFEGNKFEGHTILPVIQDFKEKFKIQELTIVADSGMLSQNNLIEIDKAGLFYILGGRVKNESLANLTSINQELNSLSNLNKLDNQTTFRLQTTDKTITQKIVYQFSKKRYQKDKYEFEKQLKKAKLTIQNPNLAKKKLKFVTTNNQTIKLNQTMIEKTRLTLGIKSYVTNNLELDENTIIQTYHNLWNVEKAFRMSKSDLEVRPVFHRKKTTIQAHILIVFTSLVLAKVIELENNISIKKYVKEIMKVLTFQLQDKTTGQIYTFESKSR